VGLGLLEGSPDLSVGFRYEVDFGQWRKATPREEKLPARYSRRRPVGGAEDKRDVIFGRDAGLDNSEERRQESISQRIKDLKQQAKEAYRAGDYDEAIDDFRKILLLEPDNALVHANLGSLYYRKRNYSRARDHYKRAVQLDPTDVDSHKYLGASYYQLGEWEQAARHFRRVLELDPGNQQVRQWLRQIQ
jgi:Flp pilus assembly protein TadD